MYIDNVVIETTRACNMRCEHCLRGNPQRLPMKREHLRQLLNAVDGIHSVTFSGGEPTLPSGMKVMEDFIDLCRWENKSIDNFYIVTNALHWRSKFVQIVNDLWTLCGDNEISGVAISGDQYHHDVSELKRKQFKWRLEEALLYDHGVEIPVEIRGSIMSPISQGRAKDWGSRENTPDSGIWRPIWNEAEIEVFDIALYLNCKGNIIRGCNFSYIDQDKPGNILCHVSDLNDDLIKELLEAEDDE